MDHVHYFFSTLVHNSIVLPGVLNSFLYTQVLHTARYTTLLRRIEDGEYSSKSNSKSRLKKFDVPNAMH